jgi:hypothetical protein
MGGDVLIYNPEHHEKTDIFIFVQLTAGKPARACTILCCLVGSRCAGVQEVSYGEGKVATGEGHSLMREDKDGEVEARRKRETIRVGIQIASAEGTRNH